MAVHLLDAVSSLRRTKGVHAGRTADLGSDGVPGPLLSIENGDPADRVHFGMGNNAASDLLVSQTVRRGLSGPGWCYVLNMDELTVWCRRRCR